MAITYETYYASAWTGTAAQDYVDAVSNLHLPTDIGTHSAFANEQSKDASYDTVTEANVGGGTTVFGAQSGSGASSVLCPVNVMYLVVGTALSTGTVGTATIYCAGNHRSINTERSAHITPKGTIVRFPAISRLRRANTALSLLTRLGSDSSTDCALDYATANHK